MQKSFTEKSVSHQNQSKTFHRKKRCRNFGVKSGEMRKVTKKTAAWLNDLERRTNNIRKQEWENLTVQEISEALKKSRKWMSPLNGPK